MAEPYDMETMAAVRAARRRYEMTSAHQSALLAKYRIWHRLYAPPGGDQWPEDAAQRPGKIHITSNIVKPFVDIDGRLQAKVPRITLIPSNILDDAERNRAEMAEKLVMSWLDASEWEWWLQRLTRAKGVYGKGVLFPFWNKDDRRPDVLHLEQPHNLRIGWGSSDFTTKDWAIYEYTISRIEAESRWANLIVHDKYPNDPSSPLTVTLGDGTQSDPLAQKLPLVDNTRQPTDYEQKHLVVWDYWYRDGGDIKKCTIVQRDCAVVPPVVHPEYAAIPYIVVENDHEPGSPEGMSTVDQLKDIQIEMNRALSQFVQLIVDNLDPAWQIDDDSIPDGGVPRGGEIVAAGEGKQIRPLDKTVNTFPIDQLVSTLWNQAHRTTGEGEILFGAPASAQDSGRALAVQVESVINRMDPKRIELYSGLRELLTFWTVMIEKIDPVFEVEGKEPFHPKKIMQGQRRWKIIAPEVTPKDAADHTNTVINKVNAMLIDLRTAMDELGVDSPEDMLKMISQDRATLPLYPGNVQAMAQVGLLLLQLQKMGMSMEQIAQGVQGGGMPGREGANNALAQQQQAQPRRMEDDNQGAPATGQGGVPPLDSTTLVRSTANQESQTLGQLRFDAPVGPGA